MKYEETAISEIMAEIFVVGLVVVLGIIILVMIFGIMPQIPNSAYLATDVSIIQMPGYSAVAITHRGGDTVSFIDPAQAPYYALVYVDTPDGSYQVIPDATISQFRPGNTVFVYYNGTSWIMTSALSGVAGVPLPSEDLRIRIVDDASGLLIRDWRTATPGSQTPTGTATATPTPTPTATATPTPTPTATTYIISVSWSPPGLGTISPPGSTPGTVTVTGGTSQTFTFTPRINKAVLSISLDGSQVSSGGGVGQTLTYTLNNVQAAHTLAATFG